MMLRTFFLCIVLATITCKCTYGQKAQYKVLAIGSYNCENLFDTLDDPNKKDEDFTPKGSYAYDSRVFRAKLHNTATVIQKMGMDVTPDGPAIVGLVEIENDNVLKALVAEPELKPRNYQYVWFPTSDERGISTAMLYNPKYFKMLHAEPVLVPVTNIGWKRPTRDILYVSGVLSGGDTAHFFVNHWPSKSGGEAATAGGRRLAAQTAKHKIDSILVNNENAKIVLMGDLNDNPDSDPVLKDLMAKEDKKSVTNKDLYNPWIKMFEKGMGTETYRGEWGMIDQIMLSGGLLENKNDKWKYHNNEIFKRDFLLNKIGKDKGLPHRSFTIAQVWDNGYSDHLPILIYLVSK
jgi:endonuclease/exonuclease/phosphatase family metal-dependent hydrolase